mgnify:CR=1 FL=1
MKELKEAIAKGTPEFIHVFDERKREFVPAWLGMWKRQEIIDFIKSQTLDNVQTSYTSAAVFIAPYSHGHLFFDVDWTLTPTNVQFYVDFSRDGVDWHTHVEVPFASLIYVPAQGDRKECIDIKLNAPYMRVRAVGAGTTAANKVEVDVYMTASS